MAKYKIIEVTDPYASRYYFDDILRTDCVVETIAVDANDISKHDFKRFLCETLSLPYETTTEELITAINEKLTSKF